MKRFFLNMMAVAAMVFGSVSFTACSSGSGEEDGLNQNGPVSYEQLMGKWQHTEEIREGKTVTETYYFGKDGTGWREDAETGDDTYKFDFTYSLEGNQLHIFQTGSNYMPGAGTGTTYVMEDVFTISIKGNTLTMVIEEDGTTFEVKFTKVK